MILDILNSDMPPLGRFLDVAKRVISFTPFLKCHGAKSHCVIIPEGLRDIVGA